MALNELMDGTLQAMPECLAICYVDMPEELVLTRRSVRPFNQETLDALAAIAARMLDGRGMCSAWRRATKAPEGASPDEALFQNDDYTCLFLRMPGHADHALCLVCRSGADVALARLAGRQLGKDIANAL